MSGYYGESLPSCSPLANPQRRPDFLVKEEHDDQDDHRHGLRRKLDEDRRASPSKDDYLAVETKAKLSRFCNYFRSVSKQLGRETERWEQDVTGDEGEDEEEEEVMPPLESFMGVGKKKRRRHFFNHVKKGDCLIGEVIKCKDNGYICELICYDERTGKKREIGDCEIMAFLPLQQCFDESTGDRVKLRKNDYVSLVVTNFIKNEEKLIVSWKAGDERYRSQMLKTKRKREEKMKRSNFTEMFKEMKQLNTRKVPIERKRREKLTLRRDSLLREIHEDEMYMRIRKRQLNLWSSISLEKGKSYLKAGKYLESIQCLNKCLKIDEENLEALLTRGRLYLLNNDLHKAIQDFEQVLKLDENEKNARQYLSHALYLLGQNQENKGDRSQAIQTYSKSLEVNIENSSSRNALKSLKDDELQETKDKLKNLLKEEKRNRKSSRFEEEDGVFDKTKKICFELKKKKK